MRKIWVVVMLLAGPALAEDAKLDGPAISAALTGVTLTYDDGTSQAFKADGQTLFDNGRQSLGHWQVRGNQYCSVWPPSDVWACYDVTQGGDGKTIAFVAGDGSESIGHILP